ncbi:Uncharacterised protein [Enterobacter cloacae]|nr:Uncharacterised protein [Enterobacter cloacae]
MSREVVKHSGQARLTAIFNVFIFISLFQAIWGPRLLAVKKSIISGKKKQSVSADTKSVNCFFAESNSVRPVAENLNHKE